MIMVALQSLSSAVIFSLTDDNLLLPRYAARLLIWYAAWHRAHFDATETNYEARPRVGKGRAVVIHSGARQSLIQEICPALAVTKQQQQDAGHASRRKMKELGRHFFRSC